MAKNHSKNQTEQEQSEYHFSDEDENYDLEPEETSIPPAKEPRKFLQFLKRSKRLSISLLVFFILVFVIYKMLSSVPNADTTVPDFSAERPTSVANQAPPAAKVATTLPAPARGANNMQIPAPQQNIAPSGAAMQQPPSTAGAPGQ